MINKKNIIILVCVLAVLVGAFFAVTYLWNDEEAPQEGNDIQSIEVFTTTKDNIVRMDMIVDGEEFAFVRKEDKWVMAGAEDVKLKQTSVDYLCIDLAGIYAQKCIEENASDLTKYGLEQPFGTYTLTFADETKKTFYLGDRNPVTESYYFKMADTPAVYTIYGNKGDSLSKPSSQYKDSNILEVDGENLSRIYMQSNGNVLDLKKSIVTVNEQEQIEWNMTKPLNKPCDTQHVTENIISKVSYITVNEFINEADERYAMSGLAAPEATITLTDDDGISQTLYVGKAEGDNRYIKTNNKVYLVSADSVSFIDIDPFIYVSKFISLRNIDEVSKVEVTYNGKTHVAEIEGEKDKYTYKLNGKEVMEDTFKREVYQKIIGLVADDFAVNPKRGAAEYTVTYYMRDGSVKKSEYVNYDDRSFAAFDENGKGEFIIRKKKLQEMFASLEDVSSGKVKE